MARERSLHLAVGRIPELDGAIEAARGELPAIRAKGEGKDCAVVADDAMNGLSSRSRRAGEKREQTQERNPQGHGRVPRNLPNSNGAGLSPGSEILSRGETSRQKFGMRNSECGIKKVSLHSAFRIPHSEFQ